MKQPKFARGTPTNEARQASFYPFTKTEFRNARKNAILGTDRRLTYFEGILHATKLYRLGYLAIN